MIIETPVDPHPHIPSWFPWGDRSTDCLREITGHQGGKSINLSGSSGSLHGGISMQQSQTRHLSLSTAAKRVRCAVSGFALLCTAAGFAQDAPTSMPTRIMGTILESNGKTLTLRTSEEPSVTLRLDPKVRIVDQKPAHLGDVTANSFVGLPPSRKPMGNCTPGRFIYFPKTCEAPARVTIPWARPIPP